MPKTGSRRKGKITQAGTQARPKEMERRNGREGGGGFYSLAGHPVLPLGASKKVKKEKMILFVFFFFF